MKKTVTFLLLLAISTSAMIAQNKDTKKADGYYDRLAYTDAADEYQKLLKKNKGDRYVYERLANSYFFINDTKKAETFYKRVVKGRKVDAETVFNYAQSLKANGKYAESNEWMKKFAAMKPNDNRAISFLKNPDYLPQLLEKKAKFSATNLTDLNSKYSDFGGFMIGKDFYFASARNTARKTYDWNDEPFLDIYKASQVGKEAIKDETLLDGEVNTKYHESSVVITQDGKRMYFDRNDYNDGDYEKNEEGINQINLYYAENVNGVWKDVQLAPFNSSEFSTGHPALSPDGNTLYFSSDRPGGQGMSDIYQVSILEDGTFGNPTPVVGNINTEGTDAFPYVDSNGTLYFASNGHLGLGGLDVFYAESKGNGFAKVKNMGNVVNSMDDDFAFVFDGNTQEGFVSSNRKGGKGSDDIYKVKQLEPLCDATATVVVIDANTKKPIAGARVDFYDTLENKIGTLTSVSNGTTTFDTTCDVAYVSQAVMKDYESNSVNVPAGHDENVRVTIALKPIEDIIKEDKIVLNPIYFDYDKHNIKPQAAFELDKVVTLMKKYPTMVVRAESHTDSRATEAYNLALSNRRAQATVQYIISKGVDEARISGVGKGESTPINSCGDKCTDEQHSKNRRSEFTIVEQ
ncbi:outer membrane protein, peptidoglycan-associated lipoprotein [unidentified eubacterium SCB49]|nr:outer membrane protein, peptidoglycan-associated lipoprotein [unidentified eubacterium SCB49]